MLQTLKIENLAIIEDLSVTFHPNMTALTGQTGAGKSLLIDSLKLLFGARADADLIRYGSDSATVVGVFSDIRKPLADYLKTLDIDSNQLVIKREMSRSNKNQISVNQKTITLSELKRIAFYLGDIHEQHDISKLLDPKLQLSLIDQMDPEGILPLFNQYLLTKEVYLSQLKKYEQAQKEQSNKKEQLERLKEEQDELTKFGLNQNEVVELNEKIEKLSHEEKIVTRVSRAYEILDDLYQKGDLYEASDLLSEIKVYDTLYATGSESLKTVYYELEGLRSDLKKSLDIFEYRSEFELDTLQERAHEITQLEKKYKRTIPELIEYLKEISEQILMTEDYEGYLKSLKVELDQKHKLVLEAGMKLHQARLKLSKKLESEIIDELQNLDLEKVRFEIHFEPKTTPITLYEDGLDIVNFYIGLNQGEPLKPLYKTASGGELSRFMLALKIVFAKFQSLGLVVFDEIDMGISGKTASKVANRIHALSSHTQVLTITHLAQVAAKADHHYHILKKIKDNRTVTQIDILTEEKRIEIIAEMLSGERMDSYAIQHAKALLDK